MKILKNKSGFTLMEVMLAAGIFVIVASIATSILISTVHAEKKTEIRNAVYEDARILMDQLSNYVSQNTIDYDEYYSVNVLQATDSTQYFGLYHGLYASRFFHPGESFETSSPTNPANLGVECADPEDADLKDCDVIFTESQDRNTGQNPYDGSSVPPDEAGAIYDQATKFSIPAPSNGRQDKLFLINSSGDEKIIFARQKIRDNSTGDADYAVGMVKLEGLDVDRNGLSDLFRCESDYKCGRDQANYYTNLFNEHFSTLDYPDISGASDLQALDYAIPSSGKLGTAFAFDVDFRPITPFRSSIKDLKFIINPLENPYKAYAENDEQIHPTVTIVLTIEPSLAERERYPGLAPAPITIQRTVNTGVTYDVETYPPTNDLGWIEEILK